MGTSLFNLTPADTYPGLIKFGNNSAINGTLRALSDGLGNDLPIQVSTSGVNFTGTTTGLTAAGSTGQVQFNNAGAFGASSALFWDNTNSRLGIGTATPSNVLHLNFAGIGGMRQSTGEGYIQNYYQNAYGTGIFMYNVNTFSFAYNDFAVGNATSLGARVSIKGSGSTSATTSLLVQNSAGNTALQITDDLKVNATGGINLVGTGTFDSISNSVGLVQFATRQLGIRIGSDGVRYEIDGSRFGISSAASLSFASGVDTSISSFDSNFSRLSAGKIAVGNGTTSDTTGTLIAGSIGIGTTTPSAKVHIKGGGSTSATTSLLVQNSAGVASLQVNDNGSVFNTGKSGSTSETAFGYGALDNSNPGGNNAAFGFESLQKSSGANNTAFGFQSLKNTEAGGSNTAVGRQAMVANVSGSSNTAVGMLTACTNFNGCTVLGYAATATASNQFVVGSTGTNAGSVVAEINTSANVWNVIINGVARKILLA